MPRAAFESVCTLSGTGQPISAGNCCSRFSQPAARDAAYICAPPLEMTPCVVEVVSRNEFPSLTKMQKLRGNVAASSRNVHARCGLCSRFRATRARARVQCVAHANFRMGFLTGYCTSGLSDARWPNTSTRLCSQDSCASSTVSSGSRRFGSSYISTACLACAGSADHMQPTFMSIFSNRAFEKESFGVLARPNDCQSLSK